MDYASMSPRDVRQLIREGKITCNTSGMCAGYAQANLCVLPKDLAYDFLLSPSATRARARYSKLAMSARAF